MDPHTVFADPDQLFGLVLTLVPETGLWVQFTVIFVESVKSVLWIRIQEKVKEHINKIVNSGLFVP